MHCLFYELSGLAYFLEKNQDFDVFNKLPFEKHIISGAGSFVPYYENCKEFWQSLLPLFTGLKYLEHKKYVENKIDGYRDIITSEKMRYFIDDFYDD